MCRTSRLQGHRDATGGDPDTHFIRKSSALPPRPPSLGLKIEALSFLSWLLLLYLFLGSLLFVFTMSLGLDLRFARSATVTCLQLQQLSLRVPTAQRPVARTRSRQSCCLTSGTEQVSPDLWPSTALLLADSYGVWLSPIAAACAAHVRSSRDGFRQTHETVQVQPNPNARCHA